MWVKDETWCWQANVYGFTAIFVAIFQQYALSLNVIVGFQYQK